ncbi:aminoacyl--tRNA ligase-related protein [Streptomyces aidingensis]|uniref:tRNA synthetase class II core domain (G, H, P, S and T) n=1 Tax=Streptomyces aidingensis TaxID=910347 RepID=A0A1I1KGT9_9ACTN|nr:aminoacyl--tRNA ligase-related protein [Streptomyces aidingensis]SFC57908.1 tRNA synthetase class II core domain (G, H, P, S and T) [Streptomyces aidingensis]
MTVPTTTNPATGEPRAGTGRPLDRLVSAGWLLPTGVAGVLGFTAKFESALAAVQTALTRAHPTGTPGPSWHPPVVPRGQIERAEYPEAFPHLLGSVHALPPGTAEDAGLGEGDRVPSDTVLAPAACYSVYPALADSTLEADRTFDLAASCYRHEATSEVGRFRSFRMREFVTVGAPETARAWQEDWIDRSRALFSGLGVPVRVETASDPFFGPGARFMRSSQMQQNLKYEFVAPVFQGDPGTAIASVNLHKDHLGQRFAIASPGGGWAHSSCAAFGLERIVLALVHRHGDSPAGWPVPA